MNDKVFHRNAIIVIALFVIAVLLWLWLHNNAVSAQQVASGVPNYTPATGPTFVVQGGGFTPGPVNFPASTFNIGGQTPAGSLNSGNCSCGCNGSGGNTTINYSIPGLQGVIDQLAANAKGALAAATIAGYAAMGYPESVFVSNATPTAFNTGVNGIFGP